MFLVRSLPARARRPPSLTDEVLIPFAVVEVSRQQAAGGRDDAGRLECVLSDLELVADVPHGKQMIAVCRRQPRRITGISRVWSPQNTRYQTPAPPRTARISPRHAPIMTRSRGVPSPKGLGWRVPLRHRGHLRRADAQAVAEDGQKDGREQGSHTEGSSSQPGQSGVPVGIGGARAGHEVGIPRFDLIRFT